MLVKFIKNNSLYFAAMIPAAVDGIFTLLGQDAAYWGNYALVNEGSPAKAILMIHPGLFVLGGIIWFGLWFVIYKYLKPPLDIILTVAFIAGHSYGASSWMTRVMHNLGWYTLSENRGWYLLIFYYLILGIICGKLIWMHYQKVFLGNNRGRDY